MVWPCLAHSTPSDTCHDFSRVFKMGEMPILVIFEIGIPLIIFVASWTLRQMTWMLTWGSPILGSLRWSWLHKPQQNPTTFPLDPHYIPIKSHFYLVESPFLLVLSQLVMAKPPTNALPSRCIGEKHEPNGSCQLAELACQENQVTWPQGLRHRWFRILDGDLR